jgi:phenylalanyl-tRNA synthetase beta chain
MKFSESWLRSFVDSGMDSEALSHLLTMAGLEVEELEAVAPPFNNVVVAQVLEVNKHPDADRLNVCKVDVGGEVKQIVCGAPNVAAGLKVPCAQVGAVLPGDFKIKLAKVRGIESSGMLCSAKELGLAEDANGLMILPEAAPVGQNLRDYLQLDDQCYTLKLTPNRADCLSLTGIAREVAAIAGVKATYPQVATVAVTSTATRSVVLDAPEACPRYCGRVIEGVNAKASTPVWMQQRLERSGIRSISALVDITNYVLLELGQPMHAFDNAELQGAIHVRLGKAGEQIKLLNEQTITVAEDVLLIADEAQALALAGIMGGDVTGVTLETQDIFLESAFFAPKAIAGRARRYSFSSDSSHRFERGVDFELSPKALERATQLVLDICGGQAGPVVEAKAALPARQPVRLRSSRVTRVLGIPFSSDSIAALFARLDLPFVQEEDDFLVTPPSYRFDIEIEEDLIEEVARLHGYDNIPAPAPRAMLNMPPQSESSRPLPRVRQLLANQGYQEVINFAFVETGWESDFAANTHPIRLANPIASQLAVMRSTLIGGLVDNLVTNLKRRQSRVRLFEVGRVFSADEQAEPVAGYQQPWKLAGLAYGTALPELWCDAGRKLDFFDVKGDLEMLLAPQVAEFSKVKHPALHPGRAAQLSVNSTAIGVIGELHPEWCQKYDLPLAPVVFELDMAALLAARLPGYSEVSKFPPVIRDLAVVVDQQLELATLLQGAMTNRPALVQEIRLFDLYTGKGIPENKKSLALRITMQDANRTLQDAETESAMRDLLAYLQQAFAAELRA